MINGLCNGYKIFHINIFSNKIIKFGKRNIPLGLFNNSHVDIGDKNLVAVQYKPKDAVMKYMNNNHEYTSIRASYGHVYITILGIGNPNTFFNQLLLRSTQRIR